MARHVTAVGLCSLCLLGAVSCAMENDDEVPQSGAEIVHNESSLMTGDDANVVDSDEWAPDDDTEITDSTEIDDSELALATNAEQSDEQSDSAGGEELIADSSGTTSFDLLGVFALYSNNSGNHLDSRFPVNLRNNKNYNWVAVDTLGNEDPFSVRKTAIDKTTGTHWWNEAGRRNWVYDDVGLDHKIGRDIRQIREAVRGATGGAGYIYIAFQNNGFVNPVQIASAIPVPATYFFQVYHRTAYFRWRARYSHSEIYVPMFDITRLSSDDECDDVAWAAAPPISEAFKYMRNSVFYRYHQKKLRVIYLGFYSGCNISNDDAAGLAKKIREIYTALTPQRSQRDGRRGPAGKLKLALAARDKQAPVNSQKRPGIGISSNTVVPAAVGHRQTGSSVSQHHPAKPLNAEQSNRKPVPHKGTAINPGGAPSVAGKSVAQKQPSGQSVSQGRATLQPESHPAPAVSANRSLPPANEHRQPAQPAAKAHKGKR